MSPGRPGHSLLSFLIVLFCRQSEHHSISSTIWLLTQAGLRAVGRRSFNLSVCWQAGWLAAMLMLVHQHCCMPMCSACVYLLCGAMVQYRLALHLCSVGSMSRDGSHHEAVQDVLALPHELRLLHSHHSIHSHQGSLLPGGQRQNVLHQACMSMLPQA